MSTDNEARSMFRKSQELSADPALVGQWFLWKDGRVQGYFSDYLAAISTGYQRYGLEQFMVQEVKHDPLARQWLASLDAADAEVDSWAGRAGG